MKLYTRTGDKGQTGLLGGGRVPKDDDRIEAYGTVDELNSHIGMLRDLSPVHSNVLLIGIQDKLFGIGSRLASAGSRTRRTSSRCHHVKTRISLPWRAPWTAWTRIFRRCGTSSCPVGTRRSHRRTSAARYAVVRSAAWCGWRRAGTVPEMIVRYLNRLSDLLFVLARYLGHTAQRSGDTLEATRLILPESLVRRRLGHHLTAVEKIDVARIDARLYLRPY